jgi:hypothetical protein
MHFFLHFECNFHGTSVFGAKNVPKIVMKNETYCQVLKLSSNAVSSPVTFDTSCHMHE